MSGLVARFVVALAALASYLIGGLHDAPWYLLAWPLLVVAYVLWGFVAPSAEDAPGREGLGL